MSRQGIPFGDQKPVADSADLLGELVADKRHARGQRTVYAEWVFKILQWELIVSGAFLFGEGLGVLHVDQWTERLIFGGLAVQVLYLARLVISHLFPQGIDDRAAMLEAATKGPSVDIASLQRVISESGVGQAADEVAPASDAGASSPPPGEPSAPPP